ncbi:TonB-dependent receptor [Aridibaculum aurantiacum]|uniref:TonB-dependent receptor n=1 Tax=Aridibaculum aurantiacum TaxID=2810307 RepID=UPI003CC917E6
MEETRGQNLAEALSRINGVTMLQTGSTISKPVIHGLHGNRVLILNNGVRQEGQQWGSEHAPEIDPFIANRMTVVKGASSLRYGADAIGGAILIEPRPLPTAQATNAEFNTVYFSNNRQYVINGVVEQNVKKLTALSWRLQGTYKRGGNTRTPDYWLHNTGLEEYNYSATVGWRNSRFQSELFFSSFNTKLGIFTGAHIGNLTDLETAINSKRPIQNIDAFSYDIDRPRQEVSHYLVKLRNTFNLTNRRRLNIVLAHQENFRQEYDRALITDRPELDLNIGTTTVDANIENTATVSTTYGVSAMRQQNVWSGSRFFIPNFVVWNLSGYAIAKKSLNPNLNAEAGLRYDFRTMETFRNQNNQVLQENRNFSNISASTLLDYRLGTGKNLLFSGSMAWRAPQVNELYVNGLHHGTANFEIGDPNLKSEVAFIFSSQLKVNIDSSWMVDVTPFARYINGFINLVPSTPPTLTFRGAYPTFRYLQTNAFFTGADIAVTRYFTPLVRANAKASLLWVRDLQAKDWLQQIPSHRFEGEVAYSYRQFHPSENYISLQAVHVTEQTRVPKNNGDYLAPPAAYTLLNMEFATMFHFLEKRLTFGLGIRNLLNTRYRDYMNRFRYFNDEAGRNIVLRLKYRI